MKNPTSFDLEIYYDGGFQYVKTYTTIEFALEGMENEKNYTPGDYRIIQIWAETP